MLSNLAFKRIVSHLISEKLHMQSLGAISHIDYNEPGLCSYAYDVTFASDSGNKWLQAHQMTINGKKSNILIEDMIACGQNMDLKLFVDL